MKKTILYLAGIAAIFASCSREVIEAPEENLGLRHMRIQAGVEDTRTSLSIEGTTGTYSWQPQEAIAVLEAEGSEPREFVVTDLANGYFDGEAENDLIGAVSPYLALGMYDGEDFMLSLSGEYDYADGTNAVMVAGAPTVVDAPEGPMQKFTFKHAAGLVMVTYENLPLGAAGVRFTTNKPIVGDWEFTSFDEVVLDGPASGSSTAYVMLPNPIAAEDLNQTFSFYIPVPVNDYTGIQIALVDNNKNDIVGTVKKMASKQFSVSLGEVVKFPTVTLQEVVAPEGYVKVTSDNQITAGDYLIVYEGGVVNNKTYEPMVLSGISSTQTPFGLVAEVTITDNVIDEDDYADYNIIVAETSGGKFTLQLGSLYLAVTTDGNRLDGLTADEYAALDDVSAAEWTITSTSVTNVKFSTRKIQWNSNNENPRFATYKGTQKDIALYKKGNGSVAALIDPNLTFSQTSYSISIQDVEDFVAPTLINEYGVKVTYSSSDEDLAIVDANTGEVVLSDENAGTVTITASSQATSVYSASSASYTVTIRAAGSNTSTAENPYNPTQALALAETLGADDEIEDVYVAGIVSKITYAYSSASGNLSYRISADGYDSEESDFIAVYKGAASSANDILEGDYVVVKGTLLNYMGNTPELGEGTEVISNTRPNVVASPTSLAFTKDGGSETVTVSMSGFVGTPAILSANSSSNSFTTSVSGNTVTVVAAANTSVAKSGTLTITAAYLGQAKTATVELSQESGESGGDDDTPINVTFNFAAMGLTNSQQYPEFKDDDEIITVNFGDGANDGKYYNTGTGIRTYGNGYIKVSSPKTITDIKYYFQNGNSYGDISAYPDSDWTISTGTFTEGATSTWAGSANEVILTRSNGSGHWRLQKIVVTYLGQGNGGGGDDEPDGPETIVFSQLGLTDGTQYADPFDEGGHFTITFAGGANDGKYYNTGSGIRIYGDGTITIASEFTISEIAFTWSGSSYKPDSDVAVPSGYSVETSKWTGSAKSIVLTRPTGTGHWRLQAVTVTYAD